MLGLLRVARPVGRPEVVQPFASQRRDALNCQVAGFHPALSPDSQQLAFVSDRDGNPELYLSSDRRSPTAQAVRLTDTIDCNVQHPSWLPDGSGLIYESNCQGGNSEIYRANLSYGLTGEARITVTRLISPRQGEAERLTTNPGSDNAPRISPDGSRIAFHSNRDGNTEIYTMNVDGSRQARLTNNSARDEVPAWSLDGTKLVFNSDRDGDHEIYLINADGSGQTQLTNNSVDDGFAVWGP